METHTGIYIILLLLVFWNNYIVEQVSSVFSGARQSTQSQTLPQLWDRPGRLKKRSTEEVHTCENVVCPVCMLFAFSCPLCCAWRSCLEWGLFSLAGGSV